MKVLVTGFCGNDNPSNILVSNIEKGESLIFLNSFPAIDRFLSTVDLSQFQVILMFGVRNNLKTKAHFETCAALNGERLMTSVNFIKMREDFLSEGISTIVNENPTNFLCNYAYFRVLQKNKNAIFIHLPPTKYIDLDKYKKAVKKIIQSYT